MPLPLETPGRRPAHERTIRIQVFACPDGNRDVDAEIADIPRRDVTFVCGLRKAGEDLHRMTLRLLVDRSNVVLRAGANTVSGPYGKYCADHGDAYGRLVGLNLLKGFRQALQERLGGMQGCTHITELAQFIPTALIQAIAQDAAAESKAGTETQQPFQLERCHALKLDAEAVRIYYPRWYRPAS